jgi:hypothetical protein
MLFESKTEGTAIAFVVMISDRRDQWHNKNT